MKEVSTETGVNILFMDDTPYDREGLVGSL